MTKVLLIVVIAYSNHPPVTYRAITKGADDRYGQAMMLVAKAPPEGETIEKFMIGCSFEEPAPYGGAL